jgi:hypothetical protein
MLGSAHRSLEMQETETRVVELTPVEARPVVDLWDQLSEADRLEFRALALELKNAAATATSPEEAKRNMMVVLQQQPLASRAKFNDYLEQMKKHGWDDRTWAQRLAMLSLVPTLPLLAGKAAGLAIFGTAIRISVPIVIMAGSSLLGSIIDLTTGKKK